MNGDPTQIIHSVVQRAPQWIRHDLAAKDEGLRARAEETMAAMIADALVKREAA